MKLNKLILINYKPLLINNIQRFEYSPTAPYQIILGTNGSGKSSVMSQMNPMPGVPADFTKGGMKQSSFDHRGSVYELTSTFKSGNRHTFVKDGVVLLNEGTSVVFKELVKQEFGLTQDLVDLITGQIQFTAMSPAKRREWITELCETDYTFALDFHQKLKSGHRDLVGAVKHNHQRLTNETQKLAGFEEGADDLEQRYNNAHRELNLLFEERQRITHGRTVSQMEQELDQLRGKVESLAGRVIENADLRHPPGKRYANVEQAQQDLQGIDQDIRLQESLRERIGQESHELEKLIENIRNSGESDLEGVQKRLNERSEQIVKVKGSVERFKIDYAPEEALGAFRRAVDGLVEILQQLPDNSDRRYSRETLQEAQQQRKGLRQEIERLQNRERQHQNRLDHIHNAQTTECPKCSYRWIPGVSEHEADQERGKLLSVAQERTGLEARCSKLDGFIEEAEEYAHLYRGVRQLMQDFPNLRPLFDWLLENKAFSQDSKRWLPELYTFERDAERWIEIRRMTQECEELSSILQNSGGQENTQGFASRLDTLSGQLEATTLKLQGLRRERELVQQFIRLYGQLERNYQEMDQALNYTGELQGHLIASYRDREIQTCIESHQNTLAELRRKTTERAAIQGVVNDLESTRRDLEDDRAVMAALVKALSPTDGLIAEQLTGFIEGLVDHLNQLIGSIWTYEFFVKPCGLAEGELDYRFPLEIKGESSMVPDIAKGSTAQVEVVNLAFKLVAMVYLQFEDYPLYLDEVGASFDEQHRMNVMEMLKRLVDSGNYTQMFLISHYAGQYGAFPQAQTLVMDSANISVPGEYNQHVVMG